MDLDKILSQLREKFSPRKKVDFEEEGLHFELEPLTSFEEAKVLTALKDVEETQYIAALKRHSLACAIKKINETDLSIENIEYTEGEEKKVKSKYLYMVDFIGKWPSTLVDALFDVFSQTNREAEIKIKKSAKFERFIMSEELPAEKQPNLRPVLETESTEGLSEAERLQKKVDQEIEEANTKIAESEA